MPHHTFLFTTNAINLCYNLLGGITRHSSNFVLQIFWRKYQSTYENIQMLGCKCFILLFECLAANVTFCCSNVLPEMSNYDRKMMICLVANVTFCCSNVWPQMSHFNQVVPQYPRRQAHSFNKNLSSSRTNYFPKFIARYFK